MLWSCFQGSFIMKGPLPIGMSLKVLLSASPADAGTGLMTGWSVFLANSQSAADSFTTSVLASGADRPENVVAAAGGAPAAPVPWRSSYPAIPAMWYATSEAAFCLADRVKPRMNAAASTGSPLLNVVPWRRLKVHSVQSAFFDHF